MKILIVIFILCTTFSMAMPPHPDVRHLHNHSIEKSSIAPGGISPSLRSNRVRANSVSSRTNKILVLRFNSKPSSVTETDSDRGVDVFTVGKEDNAYDTVKASVEQYFLNQSKGKHMVELTFPSMTGIGSISVSHAELAALSSADQQAQLKTVLAAYESIVDYSKFDSVIFMHAGTGQEVLKSNSPLLIHSFRNGFSEAYFSQDGAYIHSFILLPEHYHGNVGETVGVIVHEYGHELGLPDLYDGQSPTNTNGIGDFGVMSGGSYGGPNNDGTQPTSFSAYSKIYLGWETPVIAEDRVYILKNPLVTDNQILKIWAKGSHVPNEYFLIANRFNGDLGNGVKNWDEYLTKFSKSGVVNPPTGLVIMHIDESVITETGCDPLDSTVNRWDYNCLQHNRAHMFLDVEEASNIQQLESADGESDYDDTWSSNTTKAFINSVTDPVLSMSRPYDNSINGLTVGFRSIPGKEMEVTIASNIKTLSVDTDVDKLVKVLFSKDIIEPIIGSVVVTPSLGTLVLSRIDAKTLTISTQQSINRSTVYTLSFPSLTSTDSQTIPSIINAFGTNITDYTAKGAITWTESKSPYLITSNDFIVKSTAKLTIEPGTIILMGSGIYGGSFPTSKLDLQFDGEVIAQGTAEKPIQILPNTTLAKKAWGTIALSGIGQKPSLFEHVIVKGCSTAFDIRDQLEHIFYEVEVNTCEWGFVFYNRGVYGGALPDGGSAAKLYQTSIKETDYGMSIYSSNKNLELINTYLENHSKSGIAFSSLNKQSLDNLRFTEWKLTQERNSIFDFSHSSSETGVTLALNDLHEIFIKDKTGDISLIGLNAFTGSYSNNNTLTQSVSRDFKITTMQFIEATTSTVKTKLSTGESFRVRATATSATNQNNDKKRVIALLLQSSTLSQNKFISLEESSPNSLDFFSKVQSIHTSGATTGVFIWTGEQDTLALKSFDDQNTATSLKVNELKVTLHNPEISIFTTKMLTNSVELSYSLSTPNNEVLSKLSMKYSIAPNVWVSSSQLTNLALTSNVLHTVVWDTTKEISKDFASTLNMKLILESAASSNKVTKTSSVSYVYTLTNPGFFHSFTSKLINNDVELSYGLTNPNQESFSQVSMQYSTNGSTWLSSTKIGALQTSTTALNLATWTAYPEIDANYIGNLQFRLLTKASNVSTQISTESTLNYALTTESSNYSYVLSQGWNMISIYPSDTQTAGDFLSVFDTLVSSCVYTYAVNSFEHYCPSGAAANTSTSVAISGVLTWGQGFFVNMKASQNLSIASSFHPKNKIQLIEGWNLKSIYTNSNSLVQDQLTGNSLVVSYTSTYQAYFPASKSNTHKSITSSLTQYDKHKSYWIYSSSAQSLIATESVFN
ncbi:MAG: immune inhibitor A [Candidatus Cloacimonetes bacterium]|nr:immune inhibitor A [Candidatus Cloacimonadota bacterium]